MARKKAKRKVSIDTPQSYRSLLYGVLTVIVIFFVFFVGFNTFRHYKGEITDEAAVTEVVSEKDSESKYEVVSGDTLWSIAVKKYNDGAAYTKIAQVNKIDNSDIIEVGEQLTLPPKESIDTTKEPDLHVVKEGDNLWDIAVSRYNDGYRWPEIAAINKLSDPHLIFPEDVLKLPR